jgi:hypothetical protein
MFPGDLHCSTQFPDAEQRARKWDGMKRTLKPSGLLLLEGYTPKQLHYGTGGPKLLDHLYTREMLEAAFGGFAKLEISRDERLMSEGRGVSGMSAVIDLVGWKWASRCGRWNADLSRAAPAFVPGNKIFPAALDGGSILSCGPSPWPPSDSGN